MIADMSRRLSQMISGNQRIHQRLSALGGQSTVEYAVFVAVVAAAFLAMQLYVRRSIQANLKVLEDQINAEAVQQP